MFAGLVVASIVTDLLNSQRYVPHDTGVTVVVNDKDGNLATIFWHQGRNQWRHREGADQLMLEEWAQQSLYRSQLNDENGDNYE